MTETVESTEKVMRKAEIGDIVEPDGWTLWNRLEAGRPYCDEAFPGSDFVLLAPNTNEKLAINIKITGSVYKKHKGFRCSIDFVRDGEPNVMHKGYIRG